MKFKKTWVAVMTAVVLTTTVSVMAEENTPSNLMITADTLSYDGTTGQAVAKGDVVITQADKTMTGLEGTYNIKTKEASLTGGVSLIGDDTSMSAQSVHSYNDVQFKAEGNVHLTHMGREINGDTVEYNMSTEYGVVDGNARLYAEGTTLTANHVEGWMNQIKAVASGNVTFNNEERNAYGSADHATYTQTPGQDDGFVLLTGSAHVVQNGNVLNAPELRVRLNDNSAQTQGGRSTLIITPR